MEERPGGEGPSRAMKFCTAVNCMDGRTQLPVIEYLRRRFQAEFVDMVTDPGVNRILAEGDEAARERIFARCDISVEKHGSVGIAVAGHHDCAGNPVGEEAQLEHIRRAVEALRGRYPELEVIGLWVDGERRVREVAGAGRPSQ